MYNQNNNNRNQRNNNRGKRGGRGRGRRGQQERKTTAVIYLPVVAPPEWRCLMKYLSHVNGMSNTGVQYLSAQYRLNGLFDPAVSASDSSQPYGFTELAAIYSNYIVESTKVDVEVVNRENFGITVCLAPFSRVISVSSATEALDLGEANWGKSIMVSAKTGMDQGRIQTSVNLSELFGNKSLYYGDETFIGLGNNNPTTLGFVVFAVIAPAGQTLEEGIDIRFKMTFRVKWSNRNLDDQITFTYDKNHINTTVFELRNNETENDDEKDEK